MYFGEYIAAGHDLSPSQPVVLVYPEMIAENWRRLNERDGAAGRDAVLPGGWPGRMAVIKADAYGHGLIPAARALLKAGAAAFGVGTVSEGAALTRALPELREKHCRILPLLGVQSPEEALSALSHGLTPMIHRLGQAAMLDAALREAPSLLRAGFPLDVAVKVDTGLCRLGPDRESLAALLEELRLFPALRPGLLLSHFACSDVPEKLHTVAGQIAAFMEILAAFRERWPEITPSLANSAAYLKPEMFPKELGPQMGRPGICLYGGNPFAGTNQEEHGRGFIPAMELAAPILDLRTIPAGASVSYGYTFTASRSLRLATLAAGYADAYSRLLSNRGFCCINGRRAPLRGRICMQMHVAEVSHIPDCKPGDMAWLLGGPGPEALDVHELAALWGTIPHEIFCLFGKNPRKLCPGAPLAAGSAQGEKP